jgi:biopolymer transport protein ExbD
MKLERFRTLLALPLASLFLILLLCVFARQRPASIGVRMPLLRLRPPRQDISCDGRWVFVELLDDGTTEVNLEPVPPQNLRAMVGKLMEAHAERVVYLVPSRGISYARFVETLAALQESAPGTHVGVLSGTVRDAYIGQSTASILERTYLPCDIVWPASEFRTTMLPPVN